jgi:hypothetical protein
MMKSTRIIIQDGQILHTFDPNPFKSNLKFLPPASASPSRVLPPKKRDVEENLAPIKKRILDRYRRDPRGLKVDPKELEKKPLRVRYVRGEAFKNGKEIRWGPPMEGTISYTKEANVHDEDGISVGCGWGFAGFEEETSTYWRYKTLDDPVQHPKEHCMRILDIIGPAEQPNATREEYRVCTIRRYRRHSHGDTSNPHTLKPTTWCL